MIDALHPYPVEWIDRWQLADGALVTVRPVLPQDLQLERAFVAQGLTSRSRYQRFQVGMTELPHSVARYLTEVDYQDHFALVVETFGAAGHLQIADARFVRHDASPPSAEFALAIADAWQGRGLGRRLLRTLMAAARARGLELLFGDVLHDNHAMLRLAQALGYTRHPHPDARRLVRVQHALYAPEVAVWRPASTRSAPPVPQHRLQHLPATAW